MGCGSTDASPEGDQGETAEELTTGTSYVTLRPDVRRCVSPLCGGYWVERVNQTTTRCSDGAYHAACYVAEVDLSRLGLTEEQENALLNDTPVVFRASIRSKTFGSFGNLGQLHATEAWKATAAGHSTGSFYRVFDSGIRCIRAPCPFERASKLNSSVSRTITGVDLANAPGSDSEKETALGEAATKTGLVVAGTIKGSELLGTQFFSRVLP